MGPAYDRKLALLLKQHGNQFWGTTIHEARRAQITVRLLAAVLDQESGGGHNVWGHDPVKCGPKGGAVTRANYATYKRERGHCGMQGCGPMQLTWYAFQDEADRLGGCWDPRINIRVGAQTLGKLVRQHGLAAGIARYNGTGPAAQRYSRQVLQRVAVWTDRCRKAGLL
jgi:hypothetical protein